MPQVNPFVGLFAALVGALAAFVVPVFLLLRADIAEVRGEVAGNAERLTRIEAVVEALAAVQVEHGRRLTRIEATQAEHGQRLTRIEAGLETVETAQSEHGQRLTRIEAGLEAVETVQAEHGARLGRIEDGQTAVRGELSATNERLARVEGTVAGALGRAFPERMAQAPDPEAGAGG